MKGLGTFRLIPLTAMAACLFLCAGALYASPLVLHRFSTAHPDPQVESLLYLAAGTELMQAGLSSTRSAENPDYILSAEYSTAGGTVSVRYALFRGKNAGAAAPESPESPESPLADLSVNAALDRTLDVSVADAVRGLLASAGISYAPSADAHIEGILSAQAPAAAQAGPAAPLQPVVQEPPAEPVLKASFDSSLSTSGIIILGALSESTRFGASAALGAGVSFLGKKWRMAIDARGQFVRAFTNENVIGGPLYFTMLGPEVQFGMGRTGLLRLMGDLSGGAAFITVSGTDGAQTKTRPYADAGLYAGFLIGDSFSVGADARFMMIFDDEMLVMGISAAVSLRMEL